ncbi:probable leucine-rich repeat receptor-like protein kinase At5g49770 [Punica granatum]|uniref:non-specific serine/threonine protein kinase n=1 Tax=Punica granatum TaxID=22663 RepID=A0A6P8DUU0_PUNGR|nr:probable leucine-rich repeat receptor-like protein kinase At5g49770 [Punica granatum]
MAASMRMLLSLAILYVGFHSGCSFTDPQDAAVLMALRDSWLNTPPSWGESDDPCGGFWEGITCNNSRVTALDLSNNKDLSVSPFPSFGILAGCNFTGSIPDKLGKLAELSFLALDSNKLDGHIPPSLGNLSKLYWLDLADNQLSGPIPVSPGLDQLKNAKHLHLNKNQLSGTIPEQLFSPDMILTDVYFDNNMLTGPIPSSLGYVQTLQVLRLDSNALSGQVPSNLKNLMILTELNLAYNKLDGVVPDLSNMNALSYVNLSNNSFESSPAPDWFSNLPSLTTLVIEYGPLMGTIPGKIFSLPHLQQVMLRNNAFSGSLNITTGVSAELTLVDLQDNNISSIVLGYPYYANTLMLTGNPICETSTINATFCRVQQGRKPL